MAKEKPKKGPHAREDCLHMYLLGRFCRCQSPLSCHMTEDNLAVLAAPSNIRVVAPRDTVGRDYWATYQPSDEEAAALDRLAASRTAQRSGTCVFHSALLVSVVCIMSSSLRMHPPVLLFFVSI